mmetsp:Transcript_41572/g.106360  ORF Transcript_41572/g.106360 Transcript_41572/m.106360 type:complete len:92 (-) Transcript_41572:205-480(-)
MFQGGRWGSPSPGGQAAWGAAGSPAPLGAQGLSAVPMEVYTPDGKQQTVMVPVLGGAPPATPAGIRCAMGARARHTHGHATPLPEHSISAR